MHVYSTAYGGIDMKYYAEYVRDGECCEVVMNDKEYEEMCREAETGYIEILHEGIFKDEDYIKSDSKQ